MKPDRPLTLRLADAFLRKRVGPRLAKAASLKEAARALELNLPCSVPPGGFRAERIAGVAGEWAGEAGAPILLYLHGGAYFAGSPKICRPVTAAFAARGFCVFAPAYRLAPRHPFPAALEDAKAVLSALTERSDRIFLAGDSAGGGLALSLLVARRDAGESLPLAAALFSPWTDLAVAGASIKENEGADPLFTRRMLKIAARAYLGQEKADSPLASPLHADLAGLPPLLLHVGSKELLLGDSVELYARAKTAGVDAELSVWENAPHCWQLAAEILPEARDSIDQAADFLRGALRRSSAG
ncbi:alpha/beta hydrolase [Methylocystis heyeri]|uniref:Alpha/beta hydrolase fold domain-containing protein n=1 Tax=Methylocystis heyeri TaxID=391905 RepID=A0A6B8KL03_9HYPH|nr:alpha/beta hydrolase [Methylocystis heyeri]QGM47615.1 alpha/beta hydrolase fold domain-containing protein [Methylocystis heyeri]